MDTKEIIKAFKQGSTGNCVSIAIIKAGIEIFGINNVFHHADMGNGTVGIRMRDGFTCELINDEIQLAAQHSKFELKENKEIFDYANLAFAAMCKRAQVEENDDYSNMTFLKAIETINDGEYYTDGPRWIGLRHNYRNIGRRFIFHYPGVVGASRKHCFFASYGIEDKYGEPNYIKDLDRLSCSWYRLTVEQMY